MVCDLYGKSATESVNKAWFQLVNDKYAPDNWKGATCKNQGIPCRKITTMQTGSHSEDVLIKLFGIWLETCRFANTVYGDNTLEDDNGLDVYSSTDESDEKWWIRWGLDILEHTDI